MAGQDENKKSRLRAFARTRAKKWYRKSRNLSDEKPKMKLPKYVMSQTLICGFIYLYEI